MGILDEHVRVVEHRQRVQDLANKEAASRQRVTQAWARHEPEMDAWRSKVRQATDAGKPAPPQPTPPDLTGEDIVQAEIQQRRLQLTEEWSLLQADLADEIEDQAQAVVVGLMEQVGEQRTVLEQLLRDINAALRDVATCRSARRQRAASHGRVDGGPGAPRTLNNLAELLQVRGDLLRAAPGPVGNVLNDSDRGLDGLHLAGVTRASFDDVPGQPHREPGR